MSRWGIGPVFALLSILYGLITLFISHYFYPDFRMDVIPYRLLSITGVILIIIGFPFFIISAATVTRAYNSDKLVIDGIFRYCRHPLYASFVVFIVPGIAILMNSWPALTTPIAMYFILRLLVIKEESYLESVFGSEYLEYKKRVPCIMPFGWIKSTKKA
jgi:protein-S-isoprenylcysteine O-methyltransferase Ste14